MTSQFTMIVLSLVAATASRCPSSNFRSVMPPTPVTQPAAIPEATRQYPTAPVIPPAPRQYQRTPPAPRKSTRTQSVQGPPSKEMQYILQQTNIIREWHGLQPLVWDQKLADGVQRGANKCPGFQHFKENKAWQNLASGSPCASVSPDGSCQVKRESEPWRWYVEEEKLWNYEGKNCGADWKKCGHFFIETAPEQQRMGCAYSNCGAYGGSNVWCDYKGLSSKNPTIPRPKGSSAQLKQRLQQHYVAFVAPQKYY